MNAGVTGVTSHTTRMIDRSRAFTATCFGAASGRFSWNRLHGSSRIGGEADSFHVSACTGPSTVVGAPSVPDIPFPSAPCTLIYYSDTCYSHDSRGSGQVSSLQLQCRLFAQYYDSNRSPHFGTLAHITCYSQRWLLRSFLDGPISSP
jgi:hypothetical protein